MVQINMIHETNWKIWTIYMQWFTWFYTSTLIVIGWIAANKSIPHSIESSVFRYFIFTWLTATLLGLGATLFVIWHSYNASKNVDSLFEKLSYIGNDSKAKMSRLVMPRNLLTYAGMANAIALGMVAVLWVFILQR